ncbi:MAG: hypothetical protein Q4E89_09755 [Eubacteriales bacterium]|nr:hypothetical protein [Eubacteriales bacterium]
MIIRKLYIENLGKQNNREMVFSPGINVLCGTREQRTQIQEFIRDMLFGQGGRKSRDHEDNLCASQNERENYEGELWLQNGDKTLGISRSFPKGQETRKLVDDKEKKDTDMQRQEVQEFLAGVSETMYEQRVCLSPLRSVSGQDMAGELQSYMAAYEVGGDVSININRAMQALKMWRKGCQEHIQHREAAQEQEYEWIYQSMEQLQEEKQKLETRRTHALERATFHGLRQALNHPEEIDEAEDGYDQRIAEYEQAKKMYRALEAVTGVACVLTLAFAGTPWIFFALAAGALAEMWFMAETGRISEEMSDYRREKSKRIKKQTRLRSSLEQLNEAVQEKDKEIENRMYQLGELQKISTQEPPEQKDINGLNLAMNIIGRLSYSSDNRLDGRLGENTSRILSEITEGRCSRIGLDENWKPVVETFGENYSLEQLEANTLRMVYFAFRMALGETVPKEERLPVILDDMLEDYEQDELISILRWFAASERQVIISTDSEREVKCMKEMKIPYHFIISQPENL